MNTSLKVAKRWVVGRARYPVISREIVSRGHRIVINFDNEDDHIAQQVISSESFYEIELLEALYDFLEPNDFVVDVGANVGNHSLFFAVVAQCRVLAIEPVIEANYLLRLNIQANHLWQRIYPRQFAAAEAAGFLSVAFEDPNNLGATRLAEDQTGKILSRAMDSLPEVARNRVALIKIDVEGMEESVLKGALQTIERDQPVIVCESSTQEELERVETILGGCGYRTVENFNFTATYVFLPRSWTRKGRLTRDEYLEQAIARTNKTMRRTREESAKARQQLQQLMRRVETLERSLPADSAQRGDKQ